MHMMYIDILNIIEYTIFIGVAFRIPGLSGSMMFYSLKVLLEMQS